MSTSRNQFEYQGFVLEKLLPGGVGSRFDCGDNDLNAYFHEDSEQYRRSLLTQTYCFHSIEETQAHNPALIDVCNDALSKINIPNADRRKIHHQKRGYRTFPAVKITRFGVDVSVHGMGIGTLVLNAVKHFFLTDNRSGCRFLTLDAYRCAKDFYMKNGFKPALQPEDVVDEDSPTIPMFYDLMRLKS